MDLTKFIGYSQWMAMQEGCRGEEGNYFRTMIATLESKISAMPGPYQTDGKTGADIAVLHYFRGSSDWWIVERDSEEEQQQAFGFACLNSDVEMAEMGYINIQELIENGVELDLYFRPETIGAIKARLGVHL